MLCIYHLFIWSNLKFLHNSHWITTPKQSYLDLYSFWFNWLHSLIIRLIVSYLSPHNQHLLHCYILAILALIWLVLMALFCAAIGRNSDFLPRFPFLSHVNVFSCEMFIVSRLKHPWSIFSSHYIFQVISVLLVFVFSVLLLVAVISLPSRISL